MVPWGSVLKQGKRDKSFLTKIEQRNKDKEITVASLKQSAKSVHRYISLRLIRVNNSEYTRCMHSELFTMKIKAGSD